MRQTSARVFFVFFLNSVFTGFARRLSDKMTQRLDDTNTTTQLFSQIAADLAPFAASGISTAMVDGVYCGIQDPGFRVQIKHNKMYIVGEVEGFQSRNRNVKLALLDVARQYQQLPDVDLVLGTADFSASEVHNVPGMAAGGPVLAQVKCSFRLS